MGELLQFPRNALDNRRVAFVRCVDAPPALLQPQRNAAFRAVQNCRKNSRESGAEYLEVGQRQAGRFHSPPERQRTIDANKANKVPTAHLCQWKRAEIQSRDDAQRSQRAD